MPIPPPLRDGMDGQRRSTMEADRSDQDTLIPHGLIPSRPRCGSANQKPPHPSTHMQQVCAEKFSVRAPSHAQPSRATARCIAQDHRFAPVLQSDDNNVELLGVEHLQQSRQHGSHGCFSFRLRRILTACYMRMQQNREASTSPLSF